MKKKSPLTPAEIARTVIQNMILSAPATDLNALVDLKQLENSMIDTMRETRFTVPLVLHHSTSKH